MLQLFCSTTVRHGVVYFKAADIRRHLKPLLQMSAVIVNGCRQHFTTTMRYFDDTFVFFCMRHVPCFLQQTSRTVCALQNQLVIMCLTEPVTPESKIELHVQHLCTCTSRCILLHWVCPVMGRCGVYDICTWTSCVYPPTAAS